MSIMISKENNSLVSKFSGANEPQSLICEVELSRKQHHVKYGEKAWREKKLKLPIKVVSGGRCC